MKISKNYINIVFLLSTISNVHAVSFDCSKASRPYEKTICTSVELSALDDELNAIYKKVLSINPEIKSSQREWIQASRTCESNTATLNSCIKNSYSNRIIVLAKNKMPTEVTRVDPVTPEAGGKKNDSVAMNSVPSETLQQQKPQSLPQAEPKKPELGANQIILMPSAQQPLNKQVGAVSKTLSIFNLKGFHLNMTREDAKKLMPSSKFEIVSNIDGKELSGFSCGVVAQQLPNICNFTYAGEEITGITVSFWGDRAYEIQLYFGAYRPKDHNSSSVNLDFKMRAALDTKYSRESNGKNSDSNFATKGGSGTIWESGSERLKIEFVEDKNFYSNSLSLSDSSYRTQVLGAVAKSQETKRNDDKLKNNKKLLSDM